jgi:hypothetical protein
MRIMRFILYQPVPQSVEALVLAADDSLLPTPALRWWRDKEIYRMAFADALAVVRENDRNIVLL